MIHVTPSGTAPAEIRVGGRGWMGWTPSNPDLAREKGIAP